MISRKQFLLGSSGQEPFSNLFRPNSAVNNSNYKNKKKSLSNALYNTRDIPPPINMTYSNSKRKIKPFGYIMEREELFEKNIILKDKVNNLYKELAETKYQVRKKNKELSEKEKLIQECIKENDLKSLNESKIEKIKESTFISTLRKKYHKIKKDLENQIKENSILKANIKISKMNEYKIENDLLQKEMMKIKLLYESLTNNMKDLLKKNDEVKVLKEKFSEQHEIIIQQKEKIEQLSKENKRLIEERNLLQMNLDKYKKKQNKLIKSNKNWKNKSIKLFSQKKINDGQAIQNVEYLKMISKLQKEVFEINKAYNIKISDYHNLKKLYDETKDKLDKKDDNILPSFKISRLKDIEKKSKSNNQDIIELYKSLYKESQIKIELYEKYFKDNNLESKEILKNSGYQGMINVDNDLLYKDNHIAKNQDVLSSEEIKIKDETNNNKNNNSEEKKNNESISIIETNNNNDSFNDKENQTKDKNQEIEKNVNNKNNNKLNDIEEEDENKTFEIFFHIILKNLEANHIKSNFLVNQMKDIFQSFASKSEPTIEEFLTPFINLFIESMKVSKDIDKEMISTFFSEYLENFNSNADEFFNQLSEIIINNLNDYSSMDKKKLEYLINYLSFKLKQYKTAIEKKLEKNEKNLITFSDFTQLAKDIELTLNNEIMEFLLYKMKVTVPENNSILDLNYNIILELLDKEIPKDFDEKLYDIEYNNDNDDLSMMISNKLNEFIDNLTKENTNIETVFKDKIKNIENEGKKFEILEKDDFFEIMKKYGVEVDERIKTYIYKLFIFEQNKDESQFLIDCKKIRDIFINK